MQTLAAGVRPRFFVSYARSDSERLRATLDVLEKAGAHFWLDIDQIEPGTDWRAEIARGIRDADEVLLMLSPTSAQRPVVKEEIDIAIRAGKPIRPLLIYGASEDCPDYVKRFHIATPAVDSSEHVAQAIGHFLNEPDVATLSHALDTPARLSHVASRTIFPSFGRQELSAPGAEFRKAGPMLAALAERANDASALVLNAGIVACHLGQHQVGLTALRRYAQAADNWVGWYFLALLTPCFRSIAALDAPTISAGAEAIARPLRH